MVTVQLERVAAVTDCITLCAIAFMCVCVCVCVCVCESSLESSTHPHSSHCSDRKEVVTLNLYLTSQSHPQSIEGWGFSFFFCCERQEVVTDSISNLSFPVLWFLFDFLLLLLCCDRQEGVTDWLPVHWGLFLLCYDRQEVVTLTLYNLQMGVEGGGKCGYFRWKDHICAFIDKHWSTFFGYCGK